MIGPTCILGIDLLRYKTSKLTYELRSSGRFTEEDVGLVLWSTKVTMRTVSMMVQIQIIMRKQLESQTALERRWEAFSGKLYTRG